MTQEKLLKYLKAKEKLLSEEICGIEDKYDYYRDYDAYIKDIYSARGEYNMVLTIIDAIVNYDKYEDTTYRVENTIKESEEE